MGTPVRRTHAIACIHAAYPELRIERLRLNDEGQNNDVLIVNDDLIFRFPRDEEGIEKLETEIALLGRLRPFVPLPIPEPIYASFAPRAVGQVFAGYRMLPGEPLWREAVAAMSDPAIVQRLVTQLATFLRALHGIPTDQIADVLPPTDWRRLWSDLEEQMRAALFPYVSPATQERITATFAAFFDDPRNFTFTPTVIHGDFGTGNLLFDPYKGAMTGVIDFGSATLGDPANDVAALLTYGEPLVRQGVAAYPAMEAMLPRARFYLRTFPLQDALYGVEHNDADALAEGIARFMHE
ncbi:MAG TPA: aminoglycoside phosphotransferase family protein [Thermomicrobiales bacterium]